MDQIWRVLYISIMSVLKCTGIIEKKTTKCRSVYWIPFNKHVEFQPPQHFLRFTGKVRAELCWSNSGWAGELELPWAGVCFGISSGSIHKSEQTLSASHNKRTFFLEKNWTHQIFQVCSRLTAPCPNFIFLSTYPNPTLFVLTDFLSLLETGPTFGPKSSSPSISTVMCLCPAVMINSQWYTS